MNNPRTIFLVFIGLIVTSCTAEPAIPTATVAPTSAPTVAFTPTPDSLLPEGKIIFEKSSTKKFSGTVTGIGETAILMANMSSGGQSQWSTFVEAVDKQKFTTITFNYLQADSIGAAQDTGIVLKKLRESGFERIICIGASLGVGACSSLAREPEIVGLVLVAGPTNSGSLSKATFPKLFIAGAVDRWAVNTQMSYDEAAEPKTLVLFEANSSHGASLFYSNDRDQFLTLLLDFVNSLAST